MADGFSEVECKIIKEQIARRAKNRIEFLKKRTDPCQHSKEAGFVFDAGLQRFFSMKATQFDTFVPSARNLRYYVLVMLPIAACGFLLHYDRSNREKDIRCGKIKYKDRFFKLQ